MGHQQGQQPGAGRGSPGCKMQCISIAKYTFYVDEEAVMSQRLRHHKQDGRYLCQQRPQDDAGDHAGTALGPYVQNPDQAHEQLGNHGLEVVALEKAPSQLTVTSHK